MPGCPIRKPPDQSPLTAPRSLSQSSASFIASRCQGIRRAPVYAWQEKFSSLYLDIRCNSLKSPTSGFQRTNRKCLRDGQTGATTRIGGGSRIRTGDILLAKQTLYQLSYTPKGFMVGLTRIELVTSSLSGTRSNQLSYKPNVSL